MSNAFTLHDIVANALAEDAPWGDASAALIPENATARADLVAREPGVFSGCEAWTTAFTLADASSQVTWHTCDGDRFEAGSRLATVTGPARGILRAERIGLNLVQRMSGIATLTRQFVDAVDGTGARIVDTRKTTPGLRILERQAVRDGGGFNHRFSLSDAVMVKDNHLAILTASGASVTDALRTARAQLGHTVAFEVEVDRLDQIPPLLDAGVPIIMLDNFSLADLRAGVALIDGRATVEASGGVTLETVRDIASTGVDVISVGALTHSARALDLGLDINHTP
ncbi:MAG TPA: carboxylating nicotinate-nucleotide diphosphorylase [Microbacteriaceae bacterium]|nr:carboxylating nicotinate-nucleotide diphosphorylase [Microbacteriaceae bacterium]